MTKEQADKEAKRIFEEISERANEIKKKAIEEGKWKIGLDSNKDLFKELDKEGKRRLKELSEKIQ